MEKAKSELGDVVKMAKVSNYDFMNKGAVGYFNVTRSFEDKRVFKFNKKLVKQLREGDLVRYSGSVPHVAMVHEPCSKKSDNCAYDIIHASGGGQICYDQANPLLPPECDFNRKVVINKIKNKLKSNRKLKSQFDQSLKHIEKLSNTKI